MLGRGDIDSAPATSISGDVIQLQKALIHADGASKAWLRRMFWLHVPHFVGGRRRVALSPYINCLSLMPYRPGLSKDGRPTRCC